MNADRLAEIRWNLSTGLNADPSCLNCNEHALLAEVDRLTAERDRLLTAVTRIVGYMEDAPELWGNPAADAAINALQRALAATTTPAEQPAGGGA